MELVDMRKWKVISLCILLPLHKGVQNRIKASREPWWRLYDCVYPAKSQKQKPVPNKR